MNTPGENIDKMERTAYELALERATGKTMKQLRSEPLPDRTKEDMARVPEHPRVPNHAQCERALNYALRD